MVKRPLAALIGGVLLVLTAAPVAAGGLGHGRRIGNILTRGGIGPAPKRPHRIVVTDSGRTRREFLNPEQALREIDRARTPQQLAEIISELVTYQDPEPLDLVALALRKYQRLSRPWWHPGRWLLAPELQAPLLLPAALAGVVSLLLRHGVTG